MRAVKQARSSNGYRVEPLEERRLMAYGFWPRTLNMDDVFAQYPWLTGGGNGVAEIDKGIDYFHPVFGGDRATNVKGAKIVNVFDYVDGDTDPFPEADADDPFAGHGTGVASILVAAPFVRGGEQYRGILSDSLVYNLKEDVDDSQNSIMQALQWVLDNHASKHITAVNLTDFIGTPDTVAIFNDIVKQLWEQGVFIATPVANNFLGDADAGIPPRTAIGNPGSSPYIFATGGVQKDTLGMYVKTQRGPELAILAPAKDVTIAYYDVDGPANEIYVVNGAEGNSWGTPHVVGTAVLIQQIDPTITPDEIMAILQDSGVDVVDPDPVSNPDGDVTYARLDMLAAIQLAYARRDDAFDQGGGNDSLATAGTITLNGNRQGSAANQKLLIHDHDYYKFTVTAGGKYDVDVTRTGGVYPGAELLDANGNLITAIGAGGLSGRALSAGTYYVHLYDADDALDGKYSVSIDGSAGLVVSVGENGTFNASAFDASGNLNFAWYDGAAGVLRFAKRSANDVWGSVRTIDGGTSTGLAVSMALDKNGRPGVAYYDAPNANLKYAHFNGNSWTVEVVDSKNSVGLNPSLKFNGAGQPVITYYKATGGDLRMAVHKSSGWSITAIDATGNVGQFSSLALNPATGRWAVAYTDYTAGGFKYASQNANGTWSKTLVDAPGAGGGYVSLAFDKNKQPGFSYYDAKAADLRLARLINGKWSKTVVASKGSQGTFSNLIFDPRRNFNPGIFYWRRSGNTFNAARSNGATFSLSAIATNGGMYAGVALDKDGNETAIWRDDASGDLKFKDL
jgi:hypothetical protein